MPGIFPEGEFLPPDTPLGTGCNASRCIALPNPSGPGVEILEPEPVPDESEDSTGTVYNTPASTEPAPVQGWTANFPAGGTITCRYLEAGTGAATSHVGSLSAPRFGFNIKRGNTDVIAPGSLRFTLNGRTYVDRQGDLVSNPDPETNAGTPAGSLNYVGGWVVVDDWDQGDGEISVKGLGLIAGATPVNRLFFRTPGAPILQASLTVQAISYENASLIQATADVNGDITGPLIEGKVDVETGVVECFFGEWVTAAGNEGEWWYNADAVRGDGQIFKPHRIVPSSAKFSAVVFTSIPLDPGILGLDSILLPSDGRVPVFQSGDSVMLVQRKVITDGSPSDGATVNLGLANVSWVQVSDANGATVVSDQYTISAETGTLTWSNPLDLSAYTGPFQIQSLSYVKRLCTDVEINGRVKLASGVPFDMLEADADVFLCSKLIFQPDGGNQDLQALALNLFTQEAWTSEWSDAPIGNGTTGQYDDINYPVVMTNNGSVTERWRLEFIDPNTVNVVGETFGQVITGASIASDIAPVNPATGTPFFTIRADGWSGGWETGNVVRFNTLGANDPVWLIRSVQPGDAPELTQDRFIAHLQGDTAAT